ncbi:CRTAC1 family protein [Cellulophaga baltica 4]|nr:CRTAC1 family protein [Cellulophaga baltica 4]
MRDITDHDFQEYSSQSTVFVKGTGKLSKEDLLKKLKNLESVYLPNYMFQNNGNLSFTNSTEDWGMNQASLSNGSAYADFDNDGDLDLVMNTINATPLVYKNNSRQLNKNHYLQLQLKADKGNIDAVGAQLTLYMPNDTKIHQEITPVRGYLSTSSLKATIGVGTISKIDSVHIKWPGGTF